MFSIAKSVKGQEFLYDRDSVIYVGSRDRAEKVAQFLNEHNGTSNGIFKCKDMETWYVHEDICPVFRLTCTKGNIKVRGY